MSSVFPHRHRHDVVFFLRNVCFSQNYNVKINAVLLPAFCQNWVLLISCLTSCLAFSHRRGYNRSGTSEVCFCFVSDLNTTDQVPVRYNLFLRWIHQRLPVRCIFRFWCGYRRCYRWGTFFCFWLGYNRSETMECFFVCVLFVSDLDRTDQLPWGLFLLLSWIQQICTKWGTFSIVSDLDTTPVTSEVLFSFFWLGYNRSVPVTYICRCFWLG